MWWIDGINFASDVGQSAEKLKHKLQVSNNIII